MKEIKTVVEVSNNTEVTKSQRNRRRQRRLQIFLKKFTLEAWKINVKSLHFILAQSGISIEFRLLSFKLLPSSPE